MANLSLDQTLSRAKSHAKKGELDEAQKLYHKVLQVFPKNGRAQKGLDVLRTRIASTNAQNPPQELLHRLLGHYQKRRFNEAEKLAVFITQEFPEHQFAWKVLGVILKATGRKSEALEANKKAVALSPQDAEAYFNLGNTLKEVGKLERARESYKQAISLDSNSAKAHFNLGNTFKELSRLDEAEASYKQAIALKPDYAEVYYNLGILLKEMGRLDESVSSYKQAIALKPDYAVAFNNLGITLKELGRLDESEASFQKAIALKPDYAEAFINFGNTLKELGRLDESESSYKQAIALKPDYAQAHRELTSIKKFDEKDEQYLNMQELYNDENISEEQRCHINFGLAKACEDLGDFKQAFTHYREGNELRKKLLKYDINKDVDFFDRIKTNYPRIEQSSLISDELSKSLMPVFIVGMPRSGTTLVEQIISSHPQITGAGELNYAAQFGGTIATGLSDINHSVLLDFRHKYLAKLKDVSDGNLIVTDKMPQNFRFMGLLAAAFPEAKIIHVKRNPAAVCWANYKQYFTSKNLDYCFALDDVVSYHGLYKDIMEFWTRTLSERIYDLDYELLTVNQESETRQLIDYLGLAWDKTCLSPQKNERSVATASNVQIRKKVYKGSSEQWKKYQPFLNGAFDCLLSQRTSNQSPT